MSKPMSMTELADLLKHIQDHHSFCQNDHGKHVKYVDPKIDTRDWKCFAITFRGAGTDETFHTQNECRHIPESLYERCMNYLDEGFV